MIQRRRSKPRPGRLQGVKLAALRMECWERDKGLCQICGKMTRFDAPHTMQDSYHMAHKKSKRVAGDNLANVRVECGGCHREYHNFGPSRTKPCPPK